MKKGDLILLRGDRTRPGVDGKWIRGWNTCPESYGLHEAMWIESGRLGVVIDIQQITCCTLIGGIITWVEFQNIFRTSLVLEPPYPQ